VSKNYRLAEKTAKKQHRNNKKILFVEAKGTLAFHSSIAVLFASFGLLIWIPFFSVDRHIYQICIRPFEKRQVDACCFSKEFHKDPRNVTTSSQRIDNFKGFGIQHGYEHVNPIYNNTWREQKSKRTADRPSPNLGISTNTTSSPF
jgi:hypothetical protein